MPSVFDLQSPNGVIHHVSVGVDLNDYKGGEILPVYPADSIALPEVVPFAPWSLGAITEVVASLPYDAQITHILDIPEPGVGFSEVQEIHIFKGEVGSEELLCVVPLADGKLDFVPVQTPILSAGERISAAVARPLTIDPEMVRVRIKVKEALLPN